MQDMIGLVGHMETVPQNLMNFYGFPRVALCDKQQAILKTLSMKMALKILSQTLKPILKNDV